MKHKLITFVLIFNYISSFAQNFPYSFNRSDDKYKLKYNSYLNEGENSLTYGEGYLVSFNPIDERYVLRLFQGTKPFLLSETRYVEKDFGTKDGRCLILDVSNLTYEEGEYIDNKKEGPWIIKDTLENTLALYNYERNFLMGPARYFFSSGQISKTGNFLYGQPDGVWQEFYENGNLKQEENYLSGRIHGKAEYFSEIGEKLVSDLYENGKLINTIAEKKGFDPNMIRKIKSFEDYRNSEIYTAVEQNPEFVNGIKELYKWLESNITYPQNHKKEHAGLKVFVKFVVEKDGSIGDIIILKSKGYEYDQEAVRVLKKMPKWKPGMQNGKLVRVYYQMPVIF